MIDRQTGDSAITNRDSVWSRYEQISDRYLDSTAVIYGEPEDAHRWLYRELTGAAEQFRRALDDLGVGPQNRVAIYSYRHPETIALYLAALSLGAVYVPLHPAYPEQRVRYILEHSRPAVVCVPQSEPVHECVANPFRARYEPNPPSGSHILTPLAYDPDHAAQVMYTSGSTGQPKGVVIPNRGIVRLVCDTNYIDFSARPAVLQLAAMSFDAATFEIWGPLLNGGTCVLYPGLGVPDPGVLKAVIERNSVSVALLTTSLYNAVIANHPDALVALSDLLVGGEVMSPAHARLGIERLPSTRILNCYGPTENSVITTFFEIPRPVPPDWTSIPIGSPVTGTYCTILDDRDTLVTPGEVGELFVGGAGVALGYLDRPDLTRQQFVRDSEDEHATHYRTGDLVRQREDGTLDFVGRRDSQVKIRGNRIELGEIEACMLRHSAVREACVVVRADKNGESRLVGYYVADNDLDQEIRNHLKHRLPDYMIPRLARVAFMPLNSSGKLDANRLPNPFDGQVETALAESRSLDDLQLSWHSIQDLLTQLWHAVLPESAGIRDDLNFFDAGGTSIDTLELAARMSRELHRKIPVVKLFEYPTIGELNEFLEGGEQAAVDEDAARQRSERGRSARRRRRQPR